jgi:hypothetical protein
MVLFAVLLLFTHSAYALWVKMTECELVEQSTLIVLGEYMGESQIQPTEQSLISRLGVINVETMLKGTAEDIVFIEQAYSAIKNSSDIQYKTQEKGIWFLKPSPMYRSGVFLANHPQRFKPINELLAVKALITGCQ